MYYKCKHLHYKKVGFDMHRLLRYFLLAVLVTGFGQIYFLPFTGHIRFSIGIVVLNLIIVILDDIDELILCFTCGVIVSGFRILVSLLFLNQTLSQAISINIPAMFYYISFGIIIKIFLREKRGSNLNGLFILFAATDSISNIFEAVIRNSFNYNMISFFILVAFIRSLTAYCVYLIYNREKLFILNKEHQKRYTELNLLTSKIQAEMFYLKKSMKDIEDVMSKSHNLYESCKGNEDLRRKTLDIAREVHEIKKDYYRVLSGFEIFVNSLENDEGMTLSNIGLIIRDNTYRILKYNNKSIKFTFICQEDFQVKSVYKLFTILNNLIVNSIEACKDGDSISVLIEDIGDKVALIVEDNGGGIGEDELPYIFNPGFTTKYDEVTGQSSTGIGLCHVKNIVEDLGGTIQLKSQENLGTAFIVRLPKKTLNGG
jgi:two-component system, sensor histidine kinase YcbA